MSDGVDRGRELANRAEDAMTNPRRRRVPPYNISTIAVPSPDDDVIELRCTRLANGSVRWVGDYDDAVWPGDGVTLAVVPAHRLAVVTRERDEAREAMVVGDNARMAELEAAVARVEALCDHYWGRDSETDDMIEDFRAALAGDTTDG